MLAQILGTSFKSFAGILVLPKVPLFLLFKAVASLSACLTPVLEKQKSWFTKIFCLINSMNTWMVFKLPNSKLYRRA